MFGKKLKKLKKELADPNLSKQDRIVLRKQIRQIERERAVWSRRLKWGGAVVLLIVIVSFFIYLRLSQPKLPPVDIAGHIEVYPESRLSDKKIPVAVQKHILEHSQAGIPGVVLQYNCLDYQCRKGFKDVLKRLVERYPHLYTAPSDYDAKIVITVFGRQKILDSFDENKITAFIEKGE